MYYWDYLNHLSDGTSQNLYFYEPHVLRKMKRYCEIQNIRKRLYQKYIEKFFPEIASGERKK
jgi:hypothetical protein